ncbi:MAG: PDZ domain-containing protein [Chloroflexi bacterium]|nr:PDZ domain-containing protein [Chloroflexota bacterium]
MSDTRFSGKQVVGIVLLVLVVLGLGLAGGGWLGYRLGKAEGAPAVAVAPQLAVPDQQQAMPFGQVLPNVLPAGGPYLGVEFQMITPEVAASEGITGTTGALIRSVMTDGPAAKAGLKEGDIITAVNGQAIDTQTDLRSLVAEFKSGDEITLTVVKGTPNGPIDQRDVKVTLGERPATQQFDSQLPDGHPQIPDFQLPFGNDGQSAPAADGPYLGVEFETLTPELQASEGLTGTTGAIIRTVIARSPAAAAGLQPGDVVTAVDGKSVDETNTLRALVQSYKAGDEITLTVVTGTANGPTDQREVKVTLTARPAERQFQLPSGQSSPGRTG